MSYEGILELVALPAGLLMMLGLFTRQVSLVLGVMYFILFVRRVRFSGARSRTATAAILFF